MQFCGSLSNLWHCLSLELEWTLTFSSPVATAEFSIFAGILSAALSQHHLRIWNSSTGIPSPPLALFVVMLPKAHLTSHSRKFLALGEWSHHRDYLGHEDLFLYSSFVYSCHLFLISSASARSIPFLSFIVPIFAWNVPLVSLIFLKRSLVFAILLFSLFLCLDCWGRLSYLSLLFFGSACKWVYLCFSPLLFASLLFTAICKASSDSYFAFLHFFFLGDGIAPCLLYSVMNLHP